MKCFRNVFNVFRIEHIPPPHWACYTYSHAFFNSNSRAFQKPSTKSIHSAQKIIIEFRYLWIYYYCPKDNLAGNNYNLLKTNAYVQTVLSPVTRCGEHIFIRENASSSPASSPSVFPERLARTRQRFVDIIFRANSVNTNNVHTHTPSVKRLFGISYFVGFWTSHIYYKFNILL